MKTKGIINSKRRILLAVMSVGMIFGFSSCSTKVAFQTSSVVPSAEGSVNVKQDKNDNYNIQLNEIRLADPERLDPPMKPYMVWIETEKDGAKSIGNLKTSTSGFSKTLKSSLETVSAFKPTEVFITAESSDNVQYPGRVVLRTAAF